MSNSAIVSRLAGEAIGADEFLANMGSEEFLLCLSRQALDASCVEASVQPRPKVRETRAALVEHFATEHFVYPSARFAPTSEERLDWLRAGAATSDAAGDMAEADGEASEHVSEQGPDEVPDDDASDAADGDPDLADEDAAINQGHHDVGKRVAA